jgi:hypothetical protein
MMTSEAWALLVRLVSGIVASDRTLLFRMASGIVDPEAWALLFRLIPGIVTSEAWALLFRLVSGMVTSEAWALLFRLVSGMVASDALNTDGKAFRQSMKHTYKWRWIALVRAVVRSSVHAQSQPHICLVRFVQSISRQFLPVFMGHCKYEQAYSFPAPCVQRRF